MSGTRFTVYLNDQEYKTVQDAALAHGTSASFVVRLAIRKLLQMPLPASVATEISHLPPPTSARRQAPSDPVR